MRYAVVKDDMVTTVIIANEGQKEELETALSAEFVDASEYNLTVGDLWNGTAWTRNIDGEQVVLSPSVTTDERLASLEAAVEMLCMEDVEV